MILNIVLRTGFAFRSPRRRRLYLASRGQLMEALPVSTRIAVSPLAAEGAVVFAKAYELGLEGIVSKRQGSFYKSGPSRNWLKTKNPNRSLPEIQRVR